MGGSRGMVPAYQTIDHFHLNPIVAIIRAFYVAHVDFMFLPKIFTPEFFSRVGGKSPSCSQRELQLSITADFLSYSSKSGFSY
jgi:hypothetical protein